MLLVDSTVWVDYFNGRKTPQCDHLHRILDVEQVLVGDLILAEVLQGFRGDRDYQLAHQALSRFEFVNLVSPSLAIKSALNYRALRKKGITVRKTIDSLIATFCIENECPLLHSDSDYDAYETHLGLIVVHP